MAVAVAAAQVVRWCALRSQLPAATFSHQSSSYPLHPHYPRRLTIESNHSVTNIINIPHQFIPM